MDAGFNGTFITLSGFVDLDKYRYLYFIILLTLYIFILCTNCTIMCLILIHRNLHEPMYIFIAALSLNSVLFSTVLYPKIFIDVLSQKQIISHSACMFQYFMCYCLGASDFLLLLAMSYDRYVSICKPLQYPTIMGKRTVAVLLTLAWFIPACHIAISMVMIANHKMCNSTLRSFFCNNSIYQLHCATSRVLSVWGLVILVNLGVIPVIFILFTYIKIFVITFILNSCVEVRKKATETCLPHLMVLISFFLLCAFDIITARLESELQTGVRSIMTLIVFVYSPLFNPIIYGIKMKEISKHIKGFCPISHPSVLKC
ncbi:olfactory receptor 10J4-like [Entelurus aequoreus]|uniref:olfactory receptor 10J4-like n=1 Tax=Entelurus aequoreus TaxID=161455 RepID=UPI002B1CFB15|nr:olfactory receptor 10J4-like [Entelurus aequoreus]